jgi:Ni/Fe-hydrogenase subunit HybB-like protein
MTALWGVLAALGVIAFVIGLSSGDAAGTWSIYLVNLVFWSGLAATGPAIAGMMQITEARWSPSVRRIALTTAGFLPVSFVLILILFAGRATLYGWVRTPIPVKEFWLNTPFFWGRTVVLAAALFLTCFAFVKALLRDPAAGDEVRERGRRNALAVGVLFLWMLTLTLWGFDLVMSIDPKWYSGLFGGYFVVSTLYTGFALSILPSGPMPGVRWRPRRRHPDAVAVRDVHHVDVLFWSQYLVIWYGNVPVETRFFLKRVHAALADARLGGPDRRLAHPLRVSPRPPDRPAARTPHRPDRRGPDGAGGHLLRARVRRLSRGVPGAGPALRMA